MAFDDRRLAVEVTACVDPDVARFLDALDSKAVYEDVDQLSRLWEIRLHEDTRLSGLIELVGPLLRDLEASGISGVARPDTHDDTPHIDSLGDIDPRIRGVVDALFEHGIDTAWSHAAGGRQPLVEFIRRSTGGEPRTEHLVTDVVNAAARAKTNVLSRLAALRLDGRHLLVWIDSDMCRDVDFSLWEGRPAAAPQPDLPEVIDGVWVGTWSWTPGEGKGYAVIWEAENGQGWRYPNAVTDT